MTAHDKSHCCGDVQLAGRIELECECCGPQVECTQLVQFTIEDCRGLPDVLQKVAQYVQLVKNTYGPYSIRGFNQVALETSGADTWLLNFIVSVPCDEEPPRCEGQL